MKTAQRVVVARIESSRDNYEVGTKRPGGGQQFLAECPNDLGVSSTGMKRTVQRGAEKRKGKPFVYPLKQMKALKDMRIAEYKPNQIMDRWEELEKDKFYSINGIDFITVAASFDKRPLK